MVVELAPVVERRLGALPASAEFLRRLDVAGIIDELCPVRDVAHLTHGQVIEALVANRLSSPTSMVRVEDWARKWAVEEVFGIEPALLNDDRIARALDAIAPHLEEITGSVGAQAIAEFGIDTAQIHWDMTSISMFGAYDDRKPSSRRSSTVTRRTGGWILSRCRPVWRSPATAGSRSSTGPTTAARAKSPKSSAP